MTGEACRSRWETSRLALFLIKLWGGRQGKSDQEPVGHVWEDFSSPPPIRVLFARNNSFVHAFGGMLAYELVQLHQLICPVPLLGLEPCVDAGRFVLVGDSPARLRLPLLGEYGLCLCLTSTIGSVFDPCLGITPSRVRPKPM